MGYCVTTERYDSCRTIQMAGLATTCHGETYMQMPFNYYILSVTESCLSGFSASFGCGLKLVLSFLFLVDFAQWKSAGPITCY